MHAQHQHHGRLLREMECDIVSGLDLHNTASNIFITPPPIMRHKAAWLRWFQFSMPTRGIAEAEGQRARMRTHNLVLAALNQVTSAIARSEPKERCGTILQGPRHPARGQRR